MTAMKSQAAGRAAGTAAPAGGLIRIRGARQNNLKNIDLDIRTGEFTVVTGLSGSGKSSLVFDTLYAEGQRRYVETFSPYARQFLDRMNRPHVDRIEGVPPAIAIDQNSVVRTSRSTVGTMTELNDHIKLLFAHHATLYCPSCGRPVREHTPQTIWSDILERLREKGLEQTARLYITFTLRVPENLPLETAENGLSAQGFTHIVKREKAKDGTLLYVASDRFRAAGAERSRAIDAVERALEKGAGSVQAFAAEAGGEPELLAVYRRGFVCADCGLTFSKPQNSLFSFNSPLGACETCRGFGRVIGVDPDLVVPDPTKTLAEGAVKPWTTAAFRECQDDLLRLAAKHGVPTDTPWEDMSEEDRAWVWNGDSDWAGHWNRQWYGVRHFFEWLETKAYKLHVRVMLSRYRSYSVCPACGGSHLKQHALFWRYGTLEQRRSALAAAAPGEGRFKPLSATLSDEAYDRLPGFNFHELMTLPIAILRDFFASRTEAADEAEKLLLGEISSRLGFLCDVGVGYLTLDRQSRTLSGGEVQRVNLTTALGTSLVNTLFVLDEPSIGLHPRDMDRVNAVMRRLTAKGNTLVVVEHDPQVMLAATRLIDMGPGAGASGGRIIYDGTTRGVLSASTLTADYLSGRRRIVRPAPHPVTAETPRLIVKGAAEHNLQHIDAAFPLKSFVAVAGVSGSGKSTLISDILVPALERRLGKSTAVPGKFDALEGTLPSDVIFVDQSPIGRTTRGNPVSYVKSFDGIRRLFADSPQARAAGLGYADFSFNTGNGRCPACGGTGTEHVEMQFLSDVYLPCPECGGRRYRESTLAVKLELGGRLRSIADVLDMTVDEACEAFAGKPDIISGLSELRAVGLGYLTLGQPLTTLSGGERQRLKLAGHLAEGLRASRRGPGKLFVFDEPTTGLHFADIATLIRIFDGLVMLGHSVIVIEHNLDVLNTADWVIELGPDGGSRGGRIVFEGDPDALAARGDSPTGRALAAWRLTLSGDRSRENFFNLPPLKPKKAVPEDEAAARGIAVSGAREHNLRDLSVVIPRDKFTVVTGPSGSGKSTLAFDIIFAEGQRRYLESLNAYARSMVQPAPVPDVDSVRGIPPTVAIEQRTSRGGMRSTVATMTEVYHFLRLLFVKLGVQYCPDCGVPAAPQSRDSIVAAIRRDFKGRTAALLAPIVRRQKGSFRKELADAALAGFSVARIDGAYVDISSGKLRLERYSEHDVELPVGLWSGGADLGELVDRALLEGHGRMIVTDFVPTSENVAATLEDAAKTEHSTGGQLYSTLSACPVCLKSFPPLDPRLFSYNSSVGACPACSGYGVITAAIRKAQKEQTVFSAESDALVPDEDGGEETAVCPECGGTRLNRVARAVRWQGLGIADIGAMTVDAAADFFRKIKLSGREAAIGHDALEEIKSRLAFMQNVGLGYLTLDRSAPTLSGGEAQRIRLAAQLGSNLRGVCYVLDEPTIGLHPRDNGILLGAIAELTRKGNTLLVVEHDEETIRRADHIVDIGPGSGSRGGRLIAEGTIEDIEEAKDSLTGECLLHPLPHTGRPQAVFDPASSPKLTLRGVTRHNIRGEDFDVPLGMLTAVTGVSGSGKSTLTHDVLYENLRRALAAKGGDVPWKDCAGIEDFEQVDRVLEVDQTPIGKTPRSCPATYIGFFDAIRKLYAATPEGQARGYGAGRFSFNNRGGRCEACAGQGFRTVEMSFLPDVKVLCEVCGGQRFNPETLAVTWKGKSIGEVLQMEVDEALEFFSSIPAIAHPLSLMRDIGLGYLTLGQPSPTLSGGEAQRIKLVTELAKVKEDEGPQSRRFAHTLYVLDEPTVGLHMADVAKLTNVLKRLVKAGSSVVVVEHNLDVIAEADWVIDMGPEGGSGGGRAVACGTPAEIARRKTHTGRALAAFLKEHRPQK
jgi:excinuclease ABC subunit A